MASLTGTGPLNRRLGFVRVGHNGRGVAAVAGCAALIAIATALGLISQRLSAALFGTGDDGVITGVALVVVAGAPTAWRLRRDSLDPPGLFAVFMIFEQGITSLAWLGSPLQPGPGLNEGDIATALRVVALALAIFGVGARLVSTSRRSPDLVYDPQRAPSRTALVAVFIVSVVGVVLALSFHAYGYLDNPASATSATSYGQLISFMGEAGLLVVLATAITYFSTRDTAFRLPLIAFVLIEVSVGFFTGDKTSAVTPLLFVLLAFVLVRRRIPVGGIAVAAFFTFVLLVPANQTLRNSLRGQQQTSLSAAARLALSHPLELNPVTAVVNAADYIGTRFRAIDSIALVVTRTPSYFPYANGKLYVELPAIILVPRAIWPGKPSITTGGEFSHTYWQAPARVQSATEPTQVGDLYRNFALPGVVLGMFLWGIAIGAIAIARRRWYSPRAQLVYVYVIQQVVILVNVDLPQLIANATKTCPLVAIFAWLLLPGRNSPPGYWRFRRAGPATSSAQTAPVVGTP